MLFARCLLSRVLSLSFLVLVLMLKMGLLSASFIIYLTTHALMIAFSVPHHFWAEPISTVTYLINIQPSSTLQAGIPFERLCGKTLDYSSLRLFVVCAMCFLHLVSALN
jgi:hypothetical protein